MDLSAVVQASDAALLPYKRFLNDWGSADLDVFLRELALLVEGGSSSLSMRTHLFDRSPGAERGLFSILEALSSSAKDQPAAGDMLIDFMARLATDPLVSPDGHEQLLEISRSVPGSRFTLHYATLLDDTPILSRLVPANTNVDFQRVPEKPLILPAQIADDIGDGADLVLTLKCEDGSWTMAPHSMEIFAGCNISTRKAIAKPENEDAVVPQVCEVIITQAVLASECGRQQLQLFFKQKFDPLCWPIGLTASIAVVGRWSKAELINMIQHSATQESQGRVLQMIHRRRAVCAQDGPLTIDLNDPVAQAPQALPVRGEQCNHPETFDFLVFLEKAPLDISQWRCPRDKQGICGPLSPTTLHLCTWTQAVTNDPRCSALKVSCDKAHFETSLLNEAGL